MNARDRQLGGQAPERGAVVGDRALESAYRALRRNEVQKARELGKAALFKARSAGIDHDEARALECIAHCDRIMDRTRRSSEASQRAARLYERLGDARGESSALTLFSHACALLGRMDEALEASLVSIQLSQSERPTPGAAFAYHGLGWAYGWSGSFDKAASCLDVCIGLASSCEPPLSAYQPKLSQLFVEAIRLCVVRYEEGTMPSLQSMNQHIRQCRRLERSGDSLEFQPGTLPSARIVSAAMKALNAVWEGEWAKAAQYIERTTGLLGDATTWLHVLVQWAAGELAWAQGDYAGAQTALKRMKEIAMQVEHEKLACHARMLLTQLYEVQGEHRSALTELKSLRIREQRMMAESESRREAVAQWQIGARHSASHLEHALLASRQFERWSFEDALTGIANRRAVERALAERLSVAARTGRPLSVAMIDINRFKAVNDTFTHHVGDRALQAVARILSISVRESDFAARLAGDEFVVLFSDADVSVVADIITRIQTAVTGHDWGAIAPGLNVSVSIGVSQAVPGDTVDSVIHRSDKSMYEAKPGWTGTAY